MPLITFTGLPGSGKSTWAKKLCSALEEKIASAQSDNSPGHNYSVVYHSDDTLGITPESYRHSATEKPSRASQMSVVKRDLARSKFVILDSMAYIKGFRYQLYCEAKAVATPHCVVQVVARTDDIKSWNQARPDLGWDLDLIDQLAMRYEPPNSNNRWDNPLFEIISSDNDESLPINDIWNALVLKTPPPPNAATVAKPTAGTNFLQQLDRQTLDVINIIMDHQKITSGGRVVIDAANDVYIDLPATAVTIAQLQRIRRTYIGLNRMRTVDSDRIKGMFSEYLGRCLNEE